jgi:hypothetical protein
MEIEFPYVNEKASIVPFVLRPIATATLKNGEKEATLDMYVDSGADMTLIPFSVGTALGFELKKDEDIKLALG